MVSRLSYITSYIWLVINNKPLYRVLLNSGLVHCAGGTEPVSRYSGCEKSLGTDGKNQLWQHAE